MQVKFMKKMILLIGAAIAASALYLGPLRAQESTDYLKIIAQNTTDILTAVSTLPSYITAMTTYALNVQKNDDSQSTKDMQTNFAATGNAIVQDAALQMLKLVQLNTDLLALATPPIDYQNKNDVTYSTMLGMPIENPDPRNTPGKPPTVDPAYNYVRNASGITLHHVTPMAIFGGNQSAKTRYANYYNTVTAVESFGGYILSNQLAELQTNNGLTTAQTSLVTQASSSDWIAAIASEEIGKVLRQILVFQSQTYVLMTQILQTQKQLLAAQVMTTSAIIAANQMNEGIMAAKAQGIPLP